LSQPSVRRNKAALTFDVGQCNIVNNIVEGRFFYGGRSEELTSPSRDHEGN
jgi:hypothetical protein